MTLTRDCKLGVCLLLNRCPPQAITTDFEDVKDFLCVLAARVRGMDRR
jgi:hypothetical protein